MNVNCFLILKQLILERDLELNKNPLMQYSGLLNDTVGPGTFK